MHHMLQLYPRGVDSVLQHVQDIVQNKSEPGIQLHCELTQCITFSFVGNLQLQHCVWLENQLGIAVCCVLLSLEAGCAGVGVDAGI